ncbi:hypothetical protein LPB136_08570 [Tenacibaculum todarodis]|uniref:Uncharacterized protein n=2 Tax=Tenacibaculum todarodis TaxID=1850252 RepID=A0A1L3JJZ0_9FLAO|nr:hypothetical protein LPB136_08570 [Tenacibaculum todarodis]
MDEYKNKSNIYVPAFEIINKGKGFFEEYTLEYDFWKKNKYTYKNLISINFLDYVAKEEKIIYLPTIIFFGKLEDWQLISYLAILNHFNPKIYYEFYKKGESLNNIKSEIVENDNTLVKNIVCLRNEEEISLLEFAKLEFEKIINKNELIEIVEYYLYNEHKEHYNDIVDDYVKDDFGADYSYNDQLDLDQQSPEYWDNL